VDEPETLVLTVITFLCFFAFLLFFLWFLKRIFRFLKRVFGFPHSQTASTPLRLVCISASALVFPEVLTWIIGVISRLINLAFVNIPELVQQSIPNTQEACSSSDIGVCIYVTSNVLFTTLISAMRTFVRDLSLDTFPTVRALLMASLYVTLYFILEYILKRNAGSSAIQSLSRISQSLQRLHPSTRSNIIFFVILALGTYLSLTAISAIPTLQEPADNQATTKQIEDLRHDLAGLVLPNDQFDTEFPPSIAKILKLPILIFIKILCPLNRQTKEIAHNLLSTC
jgi:hypothetical protein